MLVADAVAATVAVVTSPSAPPSGWYPDPTGSGRQRFFDGADWTDEVRAAPARLARRPAPAAAPTAAATPGVAMVPSAASVVLTSPAAVRRPFSAPAQLARRDGSVSAQSAQALLVGAATLTSGRRPLTVPALEEVPPGWYPDPARGGGLRFFDSVKWTARTRPLPRQRGRRMPVPTALVAARLLAVQDAAAVRRANAPLPVERIRVQRPAPTPSLSRQRTRTGSLLGMLATLTMLLGIAAAGYFSWTLWGSDLYTNYRQQQLQSQLDGRLGTPARTAAPGLPAAAAPEPTVPAMPADGSGPVGRILIPKIGVDFAFVAGTGVPDLKEGPGLWLAGVFPGTPGNATISGHRTTYGGPFRHLDSLRPGDRIEIEVPGQPEAVYEVRGTTIASPFAVQVTRQVPGVRLTLTTCDPVGSAAHRLVIESELVQGAWAAHAVAPQSWQLLK